MEAFNAWVAFWALFATCVTLIVGATVWILNRIGKVNDRVGTVNDRVGKVDTAVAVLQGKLENGINATLKRMEQNTAELFDKWDHRDCPAHTIKMEEFERRVGKIERWMEKVEK